jgi:hypothetical protein
MLYNTAMLYIVATLAGCAAKKPVTRAKVTIPPECIKEVEKSPQTICTGEDIQHMHCYGLRVTYVRGCEQVAAK